VIVDGTEAPVYLRIAEKAKHLRELGMSDKAIVRTIGVIDKTVAKAISSTGACFRPMSSGYSHLGVPDSQPDISDASAIPGCGFARPGIAEKFVRQTTTWI
jgi:hypothetical protein